MADIDFEALLRKQDALNNKPSGPRPKDPGGHSTVDEGPNLKHLSKQKRLELVAMQMDVAEAQDIADKEKREKEAAEMKALTKNRPMFPFLQKKQKSREQILYELWCGPGNNMDLVNILEYLQIVTWPERRHWFFFWLDISGGEKSKGLTFDRFIKFFNMDRGDVSKRVFEIINHNLSGYVSFAEFLRFCAQYLVLDKRLTEEFAYRILLRRPSAFKRAHSILDLDDLKFLLTYRYSFKSIGHRNRRALDLFKFVDADGDGGLDVFEYHEFCKKNTSITRFGVQIIQHLRRCCFGIGYWVEKSRRLAKLHGGALAGVTPLSRMNHKTEAYYAEIGEPVVDKWGYPIASPYDAQLQFYKTEVNDDRSPEEIAKLAAYGVKLMDRPEKPPFNSTNMERLDFAKDFPEVEIARLSRKSAKLQEKSKLKEVADGLAVHTYDLMLRVCGDLVHGRRPLRMAFNKWLDVVGKRSTHSHRGGTIEPEPEEEKAPEKTFAEIQEQKRKEMLVAQLGSASKGMQAVLEQLNVEDSEIQQKFMQHESIYAVIMKAEKDRRREAKERLMADYTAEILGQAHSAGMTKERTRNLAANCKILPPLPPGQAVDPAWASVYANAAQAPTHGHHGHNHHGHHGHGHSGHRLSGYGSSMHI